VWLRAIFHALSTFAIVQMDVAVAVEDAIPGLHEIVNAQVLFALSGPVRVISGRYIWLELCMPAQRNGVQRQ
jgi:hypothetical protein